MSVRTISEDTIIENICYDDLIITSGANVTLKGTLYGNVDVKDNSHFQLAGIMRGNLFVSGSATAEITGSIFADEDPGFWSSDHLWSGDIHQRPLSCQYAPWCLCKHDPALILCSCSCREKSPERSNASFRGFFCTIYFFPLLTLLNTSHPATSTIIRINGAAVRIIMCR